MKVPFETFARLEARIKMVKIQASFFTFFFSHATRAKTSVYKYAYK